MLNRILNGVVSRLLHRETMVDQRMRARQEAHRIDPEHPPLAFLEDPGVMEQAMKRARERSLGGTS